MLIMNKLLFGGEKYEEESLIVREAVALSGKKYFIAVMLRGRDPVDICMSCEMR